MSKVAVVLGATGLVGAHLIDELVLAQEFSSVVALTRRTVSYESSKVHNIVLNFDELEKNGQAHEGDVFFSCLGTTVGAAGSIKAQRVVDYDYQLKAAQLAYEHGVNHYVLVSSSGAKATSLSPYLRMKGELEDQVIKIGFPRISIIQPSLLLGERGNTRLGESIAAKVMPIVCQLPWLKPFRPIEAKEVAKKMVHVAIQSGPRLERISLSDVFMS